MAAVLCTNVMRCRKNRSSSEEAGTKYCVEWSSGQQVPLGVMLGFGARPSARWSDPLDQTNKKMLVCLEMPEKASGTAGDFGAREVPRH